MKFKEKKFRIEAFSIALIVLILLISSGIIHPITAQSPESYHIPQFWNSSNNLYIPQIAYNACGPACVQMVLAFFNITPLPNQTTLATEMHATIYEYTYTNYLAQPFENRHIGVVFDGHLSSNFSIAVQELESNVSLDRPAILLMWYDNSNASGHYRVVTGYNQTGFFFHDPDQNFGANVFFAYDLVEKLWNYYQNYALILESGSQSIPESGGNINVYEFLLIVLSASIIASSLFYAKRHRRH